MKAIQKFRLPEHLQFALHPLVIRPIDHSSLISDVESHSRNVFGSGIGPENA
jgi:hypothetical protein